ncbi:MAG: SGNH/GDSL hydrolase family protein [Phycisphaerales bacterium]|nr:MAG: SGNH/GDSL hydrolase family protein [Phycisphaerales bacterium]
MKEETTLTTRNGFARKVCALAGVGVAVLGLCADAIGLGSGAGLGRTQQLLVLGGLVILATALLVPAAHVRTLLRLMVAVTAVYMALLGCDLFVFCLSPRMKDPNLGLQGLYCPDGVTGYRLTPNWEGWYDDGIVRARYRINSLGHRDREPTDREGVNVLLIGDSFTFGRGLDQSETIDQQLEGMTSPPVDAYNLGVTGYGPAAILESFRRCDWYNPQHVVYLFCYNDVRDDALLPDLGVTSFNGYLVPKFKSDGSLYTVEEYEKAVHRKVSAARRGHLKTLGAVIKLTHLYRCFASSEMLQQHPRWRYSDANVARAMEYTRSMHLLASERGATFHVVVIPYRHETRVRRYAEYSAKYIEALKDTDIAVIGVLERLSETDYLREGHLNASGAQRVAETLREGLRLECPL